MKEMLLYLIKSELSLMIFLLPYFFWLRKQKNFGLSRFWLLFSLLASALFPLLSKIGFTSELSLVRVTLLPEFVVAQTNSPVSAVQFDITELLFWTLYVGGGLIAAYKLCKELIAIFQVTKNAHPVSDNIRILDNNHNAAFTFLNKVYLSKSISNTDYSKVLVHEMVHASHKHSYDLLITRLINLMHWFSPLHRYYLQLLKENHEFTADAGALQKDVSTEDYADTLIRMAVLRPETLAHSFHSKESIKNRIKMMYNNASPAGIKKLAMVLLPFMFAAVLMACSETETETRDAAETEAIGRNAQIEDSDASFPGGQEALISWMQAEMIYPEEAKSQGIEGKVMVKFQVSPEGKVSGAEIARGADEVLNAAAIATVNKMPDWVPAVKDGKAVSAEMVLPIVFSMGGN